MPGLQYLIPGHLGNNRGSGNGRTTGIALDQSFLGQREVNGERIHIDKVGSNGQSLHGPLHRAPGGLEDVPTVNRVCVFARYRASHGPLPDARSQQLAAIRRKGLGIVQSANRVLRVQDDSGGENGPE